jgi:hypothetical protein
MAYGNPGPSSTYGGNPGGNEDYFADAPETKGEERTMPKEGEGEEEYGETAVIPKALLGGKEFKPGEEVVMQIVSMRGDQVVIKYATGEGKEEEGGEQEPEGAAPPGEEAQPKGDTEMQSMME